MNLTINDFISAWNDTHLVLTNELDAYVYARRELLRGRRVIDVKKEVSSKYPGYDILREPSGIKRLENIIFKFCPEGTKLKDVLMTGFIQLKSEVKFSKLYESQSSKFFSEFYKGRAVSFNKNLKGYLDYFNISCSLKKNKCLVYDFSLALMLYMYNKKKEK